MIHLKYLINTEVSNQSFPQNIAEHHNMFIVSRCLSLIRTSADIAHIKFQSLAGVGFLLFFQSFVDFSQ